MTHHELEALGPEPEVDLSTQDKLVDLGHTALQEMAVVGSIGEGAAAHDTAHPVQAPAESLSEQEARMNGARRLVEMARGRSDDEAGQQLAEAIAAIPDDPKKREAFVHEHFGRVDARQIPTLNAFVLTRVAEDIDAGYGQKPAPTVGEVLNYDDAFRFGAAVYRGVQRENNPTPKQFSQLPVSELAKHFGINIPHFVGNMRPAARSV